MKKILFSITMLLSTLLFMANVNASSFNANIVGNDTFENEITLYLQVNNLVDFNGACNGLCGLVGNLNYDSKIELTSIKALEGFDLTQGKTLVLYRSTGVMNGTKILSMTFKNKSLAKDESTTITLSNIVASDGDKDISTGNASKTIKFIVKETGNNNQANNNTNNQANNSTNNNISNHNTSNNPIANNRSNSDATDKEEEVKKSSNNYLSSIVLSNGKIKFDKDVLTYDVIVDYKTTTIEIKAKGEDDKATITGNGKHTLKVGSNVINITVKAEDGSERTYTLNINREKNDIATNNDNKDLENDTIKKEGNYIVPIVIISVILVIGIIGFVIYKKQKN